MPVTTQHREYSASMLPWQRCRDCFDGSDAVKARATMYLPPLDSHTTNVKRYESYLLRALFYNAFKRTVVGLAGALFQKAPTVELSDELYELGKNITATGVSFETFALQLAQDVLKVGRYGVLVDMPGEGATESDRPYWTGWEAEDIINWRVGMIDGEMQLTRVVLREQVEVENPKDDFDPGVITQYRVCELVEGVYSQQLYRESKPGQGDWKPHDEAIVPHRRTKPLDFIPFVFFSASSATPNVERPPLDDLATVNLSHYRNSADLEHGLHYTGIPILWAAGVAGGERATVEVGPEAMIVLDVNGKMGIIQASGETLGALEKSLERKQKQMATLGARLLEDSGSHAETATAVGMRHAGEHATLRTLAQVLEQGLTQLWRITDWWTGSIESPGDSDSECELNKDFFAVKLSPDELKALLLMLQGETISYETFYFKLSEGGWSREGVTAEEEQAQIEEEAAENEPAGSMLLEEGAMPEPGTPEGEPYVAEESDRTVKTVDIWRVVQRGAEFLVVQTDTNSILSRHASADEASDAVASLQANKKAVPPTEGDL